ncbi:hypothetical protein V8E54_006821 [Elaphomyces granulatus]|jgi:hypothetical protein
MGATSKCNQPLSIPSYPRSPSPLSNNATVYGLINPEHHSNVSIVYSNATLPTPWPVLLAGLLWSFLSTLRLWLFSGKGRTSRFVACGLVLVTTLRCIAAFVAAVQAMEIAGGRFRPPSAVITLLLSALSFLFKPGYGVSYILAIISSFFAFITLTMMVAIRIRNENDYYAKWLVVGGNCPIIVGIDTLTPCPFISYVGCGLDQIPQTNELALANNALYGSYRSNNNPNTFENRNHLVLGELVLGLLLLTPFMIGFGIVLLFLACIFYLIWEALKLVAWSLAHPFRVLSLEEDDLGPNEKRLGFFVGPVFALIIAIYIATSFPLHYVQERHPTGFFVLDSYGPLQPAEYQDTTYYGIVQGSWTGDSANGTGSWSDYFYVETPAEDLGFLDYWWEENVGRAMNWLAVL